MNLYDFLKSKFPQKKFYEVNAQNFQPANYNDDLDHRCHEEVNKEVYNQEIDFLLMPISLTENFVELSGLILAHHIRLSHKEHLRKVPIILYGYVDHIKLLKLSSYARILLTDNVHYVNLLNYDFENIAESINKYNLKPFDQNNFLKTIEILPPANYDSHHSIDNEYALIRWSKYIGCYEKLPEQFRKEFDSRLYFKYLNVKNKVDEVNDKKNYSITLSSKTKILLIDDEERKGWGKLYESFFQFSPNIEFICSDIDFKNNQNQTKTIDEINKIVKKEDPDVVLLDLRLLDNDFEESTAPEDLTGIKAVEAIKAINRGIQIIVTTASNKAWNFNLAKQKGAYDFVIKDGFDDPAKSIKRLNETVEVCGKRTKFLKPISENIKLAINSWNSYIIPQRKNLSDLMHDKFWHIGVKQNVGDFLENAFSTIESENQNERFTISIILIYRILELIKEFFIFQSGDYNSKTLEYFWDQDNSKLDKIIFDEGKYFVVKQTKGENLSTLGQVYAIYYKINSSINDNLFSGLYKINTYRNEVAIHPDKRFKKQSLEYKYDNDFASFCNDLKTYFKAVCDFVSSFK